MPYGILIGRFQPLHLAHQSIINQIMHDGLVPLIFIGSSNKSNEKNPFSYAQRASIIHEIYGGQVVTLPIPDFALDAEWAFRLEDTLKWVGIEKKDCRIYYFLKTNDYNLFPLIAEFNYVRPTYPEIYGEINASDIRRDPQKYKQYLDGRVLKYLTNLSPHNQVVAHEEDKESKGQFEITGARKQEG